MLSQYSINGLNCFDKRDLTVVSFSYYTICTEEGDGPAFEEGVIYFAWPSYCWP